MAPSRELAAIMFTDLVGYSRLAQEDEAMALRLLREQGRIVRPILELHQGREVKSIGDGLLVEFSSALDAVECAVDIQSHLLSRNVREGPPEIRLRIGIHLGDVQRRGKDIVGDAVNLASRIEPLADPGGICISSQVFDQVHNKVLYDLEEAGSRSLKGIRGQVRVYRVRLPHPQGESRETDVGRRKIAVLPLSNISPDPQDEYFADGLTEELISVLSQINGLRVVSRTSVNQYKGTTKPVAQIGTELGVGALLEGSVRKAGDQLRITVQLIDPRTDEHLWTQTFDRKLENIFAIQKEVAEQTSLALRLRLEASEVEAIGRPPTTNLAAYGLYLQGLHATHSLSFSDWDRAIGYFEAAVRADPSFSQAYSHLANQLMAAAGELRPFPQVLPRAREAVSRALQLTPESADAHAAAGNLAFQGEKDWITAERELRRAIDLNPGSATAHSWYGILLVQLLRYGEAKSQLQSALDLDPENDLLVLHMVKALAYGGEHAAAIDLARKGVSRFPRSSNPRLGLVLALMAAGKPSEAEQEAEACVRIVLEEGYPALQLAESRMYLATVRSRRGDPTEAEHLLGDWDAAPSQRPLRSSYVASVLASTGRTQAALDLLEAAVQDGSSDLYFDRQAFYLDPLRPSPRFRSLERVLHLPASSGPPDG